MVCLICALPDWPLLRVALPLTPAPPAISQGKKVKLTSKVQDHQVSPPSFSHLSTCLQPPLITHPPHITHDTKKGHLVDMEANFEDIMRANDNHSSLSEEDKNKEATPQDQASDEGQKDAVVKESSSQAPLNKVKIGHIRGIFVPRRAAPAVMPCDAVTFVFVLFFSFRSTRRCYP